MKCEIRKNGARWAVVKENGEVIFEGATRISCFAFAYEHCIRIIYAEE